MSAVPTETPRCDCSLSDPFKGHGKDPARCPVHGPHHQPHDEACCGEAWCDTCQTFHGDAATTDPCHPDFDPTDAQLASAGLIVGAP